MTAVRMANHLDLTGNEIRNFRIEAVAGLPTASASNAGRVVYNLPDGRLYECDGSTWKLTATDSDALQGHAPAFFQSRANHTGTQLSSTISDLIATITAQALSSLAAPTAPLNHGGQRATNAAPATASTDLATWGQVQSLVSDQGFKIVRAASAGANVPLGTTGNGATLDGITLATGDLILLKDQTTASENGIYQVQASSLVRDPNSNTNVLLPAGTVVVVQQGTANADKMWMLTVAPGYTMGVTALTFSPYGQAPNPYTSGNGISIISNVVSAVVQAAGGLLLSGSGLAVDSTVYRRGWWEGNVPVPGSGTASTITHSLNRRWIQATVYEVSSGDEVKAAVNCVDVNNTRLDFATAPTSGQYYAVIH